MTFPDALVDGDTIAIIAPAGAFDHALLAPSLDVINQMGFNTRVLPHVLGRDGTYSGSLDDRCCDFIDAWSDPAVKAIICARGGYGAVQLLERLASIDMRINPKWLVGFSDISALHAMLQSVGVASVHASMLKGLVRGVDNADNGSLFDILRGKMPVYGFGSHPFNRQGEAVGRLVGGNLSVLASLISTPYDIFSPDTILFVEDINEPAYKIERIMWQLRYNGVLDRLRGLVLGQFTGCKGDLSHPDVYDTIRRFTGDLACPVAFDAPIGHVEHNIPLVEGAQVKLGVYDDGVSLDFGTLFDT